MHFLYKFSFLKTVLPQQQCDISHTGNSAFSMSYTEKEGKHKADFNVLECPNAVPCHFNIEYPQDTLHCFSTQGGLELLPCSRHTRIHTGTPHVLSDPGPGGRPPGTGRRAVPGGRRAQWAVPCPTALPAGPGRRPPRPAQLQGWPLVPPLSRPPRCLPLPGVTSPVKTDLEKSSHSSRLMPI